MNENQEPVTQPVSQPASNNNFLAISILVAAVLISASIFFAFGKDDGGTASTGTKKFPNNAIAQCIDSKKYANDVQQDRTIAQAAGISGTPSTFINGTFINGAQPWDVFKTAIDLALTRGTSTTKAKAGDPTPPPIDASDVILGDPNAPVTVIEYGDYQCPFCARFYTDIEPLIRDQYIKTGKVKMVFRNYPFLGPESTAAAEAVECAKDQGKYWEFHDALYAAEAIDGREHNNNLNRELFLTIAQDLKLNAK
jgi:protein-disulfide isomerase